MTIDTSCQKEIEFMPTDVEFVIYSSNDESAYKELIRINPDGVPYFIIDSTEVPMESVMAFLEDLKEWCKNHFSHTTVKEGNE